MIVICSICYFCYFLKGVCEFHLYLKKTKHGLWNKLAQTEGYDKEWS
jgi:hypothetical protein